VSLLRIGDAFLYLDKASGLPVFPHRDRPDEPSLLGRLLAARPEQSEVDWPEGFGGGILHRLDGWTSGLVVAARSLEALERGREAFAGHRLRKRYRFLTGRDVAWHEHEVEHPLAHDRRRKARMVWRRGADTPHRGRWYPAATGLRRLGPHDLPPGCDPHPAACHLWEATIRTGVMHQIRVHAASAGLPLLGDRLYGGGGQGRFWLHHRTVEGWPGEPPVVDEPADWASPLS
jgi:23S rRNA pseudouridine1911/1915/1917 synthase